MLLENKWILSSASVAAALGRAKDGVFLRRREFRRYLMRSERTHFCLIFQALPKRRSLQGHMNVWCVWSFLFVCTLQCSKPYQLEILKPQSIRLISDD